VFRSSVHPTNRLFATLLLGLQRLEAEGVLPPAHHSMLEDMLEGWTLADAHVTASALLHMKKLTPIGHN